MSPVKWRRSCGQLAKAAARAIVADRLEQVVHRARLEGVQHVLVVGGGEDHRAGHAGRGENSSNDRPSESWMSSSIRSGAGWPPARRGCRAPTRRADDARLRRDAGDALDQTLARRGFVLGHEDVHAATSGTRHREAPPARSITRPRPVSRRSARRDWPGRRRWRAALRRGRCSCTTTAAGERDSRMDSGVAPTEAVVLDRVLEQGLQRQRRHARGGEGGRVGQPDFQRDRAAEAQHQQAVVAEREGELVRERHHVAAPAGQHVAVDLGQRIAELAAAPRVVHDQVAERVQAVEEEVRVDLRLSAASSASARVRSSRATRVDPTRARG